ncbi:2-oxo acid dehydrogenase subunit E2 [Gordonia rubripertincta]|uniref:Dihydrolipoamide acetyltransferase component of pyruvate dehydrogenase complex n=2 Tax=Gordonia rubripertincta TaxID=36822 RepID=A0AAW6RGM8_GORRU|nr:2-oxo acid dehydrogenase subunit E2 [Gordonia rubripertincta]MDG6783783.1 2-oxo acid dehydrogenase subunit E2 [Gordonia rubripertincta]NKY65981.1 dihydrolipoyllysine succinyltransferase [Gordonia rubripertincta]GAB86944.1 putative dihydrolipoamide acyltransferase [Gordonia rubripertincta NBRC 101908]
MTSTQSATTVHMPALGESVEEGTITRWLKEPGDRVEAEEALLEVSTDKVDTEIPSPVGGILVEILASEDDVVAIGADLAVIDTEGGSSTESAGAPDGDTDRGPSSEADDRTPERARPPAPKQPELEPSKPEPAAAPAPEATAPKAETALGSVNGAAQKAPEKVQHAAAPEPRDLKEGASKSISASPSVARGSLETVTDKLPRIRRTIAARMVESLQTSAQLTTVLEADVTSVADLRRAHKDEFYARVGVKLSFLPFFAKAAVSALSDHRVLNASLNADVTEITYHGRVHLGVAVDSDKGLMVPVIRDAQDLSIEGLARAIADKAERVRAGKIGPDELGGGTFTLTNTGSRGALFDTPIINQPQTGILGTGAVVERVVPSRRDGALSLDVRSMAYLSISYDHRVVDGADAARYLTTIKNRLEGGFHASDLY